MTRKETVHEVTRICPEGTCDGSGMLVSRSWKKNPATLERTGEILTSFVECPACRTARQTAELHAHMKIIGWRKIQGVWRKRPSLVDALFS